MPTTYNREFDFTSYQASSPSEPLPASHVDAELNRIKTSLDSLIASLALVQRADGDLANGSVGPDQLLASITGGMNAPTLWLTAHAYTTADFVFQGQKYYHCLVAHTSGVFATDLAAAKWLLLADFTNVSGATTGSAGVVQLATNSDALAKSATNLALTPSNLAALDATTSASGFVELATDAEAIAAAATNRGLVPSNLAALTAANLTALKASAAQVLAGTANDVLITPLALSTAMMPTPQGRLSLGFPTLPVPTADAAAATTIFWYRYGGNLMPWYDGAEWQVRALATDLSLALDSNSGHTGYAAAGSNFDLYYFNDAGTDRLVHTSAWTSDTTRGVPRALALLNGIWVNNTGLTTKFDATASTLSVPTNRGVYLGTFRASANGQCAMVMNPAAASGGGAPNLLLWNMYNRRATRARNRDNGATYTYTTATIRQARASANNQIGFVTGLAEDTIQWSMHWDGQTVAALNAAMKMGVQLDATTTFADTVGANVFSNAAAAVTGQITSAGSFDKQIGYHFVSMNENGDGTNANTFNKSSANEHSISLWC